ncbi:MAG: hypothetical protein NC123_18155 [Butyrivibrio sp.]|nr:hypothetical protein [Butyrivibrio sp.]
MRRKKISQTGKYFFVVALFLCFMGCGRQGSTIPSGVSESIHTESPEGSVQGEHQPENKEQSAEQQPGDAEMSEDYRAEQKTMLSTERATATFEVGSFWELNLVVGGDSVYGFGRRQKGEKSILFQAGAEDGTVRDFEVELEPEINVCAACTDSLGNLHMLLSERGYLEWTEILVLDKSGQTISRIDVSDMKEETDIFNLCMTTGTDGNYYISYSHDGKSSIQVMDSNGSRKEYFSLDVQLVGLGTGRSGQVYGMVYSQDGQYLVMLKENGEIESCPNGEFQDMPIIIDCLRAGVQCELLIGNGAYGAWIYEAGSLEQVVSADEMPYKGQDVEGFGFLNDGRLCIMGYGDGVHTIECLPVEREK